MRGRIRSLATLGVAITLALAACGSDGDDSADPSSESPDGVVKIGVLAPVDGGLTEFGRGIASSVELAVDQANERDAVPGWTLEVEVVDDSSDPDVAHDAVSALVDDPAVLGVVGPYNSGVAEAILPTTDAADLVVLSPGNTLASLTRGSDPEAPERPYDTYARLVATDAEQGPFLASSAYDELEVRSVAVVSETKAVSADLADAFADSFVELGGEVTVRATVPDEADDFTDFLDEALPGEPDLIFFGGEYPVGAALRAQATDAGFDGPVMGGDGMKDPAYIAEAGDASTGDYASSVGAPLEDLETAGQFLADYEAAGFEDPPSDFGVYAYDAANVLVDAIAEVLADEETIPDDARVQMIPLVAAADLDGASGPVAFDELGDTRHRVFTLFRVDEVDGEAAWVAVTTRTVSPD